MELHDTVTMFCTETFSDTLTPATTFKAKVNPFAEVSNSGAASQRRILETVPSVTIPTSRVVTSPSGEIFIVADQNVDFWDGTAIRLKYPILPVTGVGSVGTIGETLASDQADKQVYAYPYFVRRETDEEEQSDYFSGYEVSFPSTKSFDYGSILYLDSRYYRLKTDTWVDGAGFSAAQCTLLEGPMQTLSVVVKSPTYDATTDRYTPAAPIDVLCFVEPLRQDYEFVSPAFEDIRPGDKAISLLKAAATVKISDTLGSFRILSIRDKGTWVTCQCRNIGG